MSEQSLSGRLRQTIVADPNLGGIVEVVGITPDLVLEAAEKLDQDAAGKKLASEYCWWFWDVIEGAIADSAKEHNAAPYERLCHVPGESFKQYVDENGNCFEVTLSVEFVGGP